MTVYKPIASLDEGYFVDETGRIIFVREYTPREDGLVILEPGKYRKIVPTLRESGRAYFNGYKNGRRRTVQVARVVAEAFKPGYSHDMPVHHYSKNYADNSVTNLHYGFGGANDIRQG